MDAATTMPPSKKIRVSHSCERCALRKVKCDSLQPVCGACTKHNAECKYRVLPPRKRRKQFDRDQVLLGRQQQYERPIEQRVNGDAQRQSAIHTPERASPNNVVFQREKPAKLLENGLWSRVAEELAEPTEHLDYSSADEDDAEETEDTIDFVLGLTPSSLGIETLHPSADKVLELWNVYKTNVDPLTKIIHVPTLDKAVRQASTSLQSIPKSFECLLFAIYSLAILSLKDADCRRRFDEPRSTLLARYRAATRAALSRAKFIGSTNLVVLQAFILHLFAVRDTYDSRTVWTLTGLALRIAERMGLHRDGTTIGLRPFDTEVRRRVWWQLRMMDGRSSEVAGTDKTRSLDVDPRMPQMPANINDDELFPEMTSIPESTNRATDMAFCSLRFELRSLATSVFARHGTVAKLFDPADTESEPNFQKRDRFSREVEQVLQDKYVRYFDPTRPVQLMATIVSQGAVSLMCLMAHHPRSWDTRITDAERRYVWDLTFRCLQQWVWVFHSRDLEGFAWHAGFYFHWHAFIHILDTLRVDPLNQENVKVWQLVADIFEIAPKYVTDTKKALHVAIGSLCLRAYAVREAALAKAGQPVPAPPWYIVTLREQRASANARRKTRESARSNLRASDSVPANGPAPGLAMVGSRPTDAVASLTDQSYSTAPSSVPTFSNNPNSEDGLLMFADNDTPTTMDFETLLASDVDMSDPMDASIDWVKWDALLSDFS